MENQKKFDSKSPEYVKKYNEEYYQKTKAKRLAAEKEKVHCDVCNCDVSKGRLQKHKKTQRHIANIVQDEFDSDSDSEEE